jgi:hypothetical protein
MKWYSSLLEFIVDIEDDGIVSANESLILFLAHDYSEAQNRASELGIAREVDYVNSTGKKVSWRLKKIVTLDELDETMEDGREVYSRLIEISPPDISTNSEYGPADSTPYNTGV